VISATNRAFSGHFIYLNLLQYFVKLVIGALKAHKSNGRSILRRISALCPICFTKDSNTEVIYSAIPFFGYHLTK
jgi:hypothetical protein